MSESPSVPARVIVAIPSERRRTEADLLPSVPNGATAELHQRRTSAHVISSLSWSSGAVHETDWTLWILYSVCLYMTICCLNRVWRPREFSRLESCICIMFFCFFLLWHNVLRCVFMVGRRKSLGSWVYRLMHVLEELQDSFPSISSHASNTRNIFWDGCILPRSDLTRPSRTRRNSSRHV